MMAWLIAGVIREYCEVVVIAIVIDSPYQGARMVCCSGKPL